ncbi:TetR/AcrR family transcriptional regulator [Solihabitans fulvus]|uniref:TetR/AcrR family transcriptional regulator n=1 Tax=Solihabitans fulvus TaxID=1892852 RepID=A0A5B2XQM3_9PSEU|nr:TetR/AcrR family transcriptional regulator [Solihabitans fulvus]KAA2265716.1 TetR/AcrR family transcriptional regulator [Solihabitans fulvus]
MQPRITGRGIVPPRRLSRAESREQTRERLLTAAAELFAEQGVSGASVEQIAERAGYSRGAFYGNFDDKHELVLALLRQRTEHEFEEVRALGEAAGSFQDALAPLRQWHRDRAKHLTQWLALRTELLLYALRHKEIRPVLAERERFARAAMAAGLEREFRANDAEPPADLAFLALILHALEDGLLIQRLLTPEDVGDEVVVDAVEILLRSWTRPPQPATKDTTP